MIAADLVVGATVGRAQVDVFVLAVLHAECNSNETACTGIGAACGTPGKVYLNLSIVKRRVLNQCIGLSVGYLPVFDDSDCAFTLVINLCNSDLVRC